MEESQPKGESSSFKLSAGGRRLIAGALVCAGLVHAVAPRWLALDWPTIALMLGGVVLLFVPVEDVGAVVESLEFGKTKILFRNVKALDKKVDAAEAQEAEKPGQALTAVAASSADNLEGKLQYLLAADKEMALMRVAQEVELLLTRLVVQAGGVVGRSGIVWRDALSLLEEKGIIQAATASACLSFRNVRNQLAHPSSGKIPESLLMSTIDSGLKLVRLLSSLER